jgi:hypothetical protein
MEHIPVAQRPPPQPKGLGAESPQTGSEFDAWPVWAEAGTLNCFATSMLPHWGQRATSFALRTRVSNVWSQGGQRYS